MIALILTAILAATVADHVTAVSEPRRRTGGPALRREVGLP